MAQDKLKLFTTNPTTAKTRDDNPFVHTESELIEAQLEAIADGLMKLTTFYTSFIEEELISTEKLEKSIAISTPEKFYQDLIALCNTKMER